MQQVHTQDLPYLISSYEAQGISDHPTVLMIPIEHVVLEHRYLGSIIQVHWRLSCGFMRSRLSGNINAHSFLFSWC